jgi:hypothetical protein
MEAAKAQNWAVGPQEKERYINEIKLTQYGVTYYI